MPTVYTWDELTPEVMTNLFLYGQIARPQQLVDEARVRDGAALIVQIDMASFMDDGPGRFANAAMSTLVARFFTSNSELLQGNGIEDRVISVQDMIGLIGGSERFSYQQYNYDDGGNDLAARTYIYNSTGFTVSPTAQFVIKADGTREITGLGVYAFNENFDFHSNDIVANLTNPLLKSWIDPSGLGRTVELLFANKGDVPVPSVYTAEDFLSDVDDIVSYQTVPNPVSLFNGIKSIADQLWTSGSTKFLDGNRPILYGTNGDDFLTSAPAAGSAYLAPYLSNGIVYVGAEGDDTFADTSSKDVMLGGADLDTADYRRTMGADISVTAGTYAPSGGSALAGLSLDVAGRNGADVLVSVEQVRLSTAADTIRLSGPIAQLANLPAVSFLDPSVSSIKDTLDMSAVTGGPVTVSYDGANVIGVGSLKFKNFEKIVGTSGGDTFNLTNASTGFEIQAGGGADTIKTGSGNDVLIGGQGQDLIQSGGGDDTLDGGADADVLQGGGGFDRYFVTNGDTITDSDGRGSVTSAGQVLTGGKREGSAGAFTSANGDQYLWKVTGAISTLDIYTQQGEHVTVTNFKNGDLGIKLEDVQKPKPFPKGPFSDPSVSPLVLDLDNNGIKLSSTASGAHFDFGGDLVREATGWVDPGDGLLVYDANHDGAINNGTELFGNSVDNGFDVLSFYDGRTGGNFYSDPTGGTVNAANVNGSIDADDAIFSQLRIWRDLNQDGIAQAGELTSLADEEIARINLAYTAPDDATTLSAELSGNQILQVGTFEREDGSSSTVGDAWFAVDQSDTVYAGPLVPALDGYPDLHGYGNIDQLHNVLSQNAGLKAEFDTFIAKIEDQPLSSLIPQFEKLMYAWAGIPEDYSPDRGDFVDGRKLAFLEQAYDDFYVQLAGTNEGTNDPGPIAGQQLQSIFNTAIASYFVKFLAQVPSLTLEGNDGYTSRLSPLAAALHYNAADDSLVLDAPALAASLSSLDMSDASAVGNAMEIFALLTIVEAYNLQKNETFFSDLRDALQTAGAGKLLPLIDSYRIWDSSPGNAFLFGSTTGAISGLYSYAPNYFSYGNESHYTVVEAGATIQDRATSALQYVSDLYYVQSGLGTITFEPERSGVQDKIILSDEFNNAPYSVAQDVETGDVTFVFSTLGTTIVLKSYLDLGAQRGYPEFPLFSAYDWSTGITFIEGQAIYFSNGTVLQPKDIADLAVKGSDGNDVIQALWLGQTIDGQAGDDVILGHGYNNTIIGGAGDDQLSGNGDHGVYIYNVGDGNDTISESHQSTLQLNGISSSDARFARGGVGGSDILVTFVGHASDGINIINGFNSQIIAKMIFSDGVIWTPADIAARVVLQNASDGDDVIVGFEGSDVLAGGRGDDIIQGAPMPLNAADTYIYARGDGNDTLITNSPNVEDTLQLVDIRSDQVTVTRNGLDIVLSFDVPEGGSITIVNQISGGNGLEKVIFSDGVVWSQRDFVTGYQLSIDEPTIVGHVLDETLDGTTGNDGIAGLGGDDTLRGGEGSDTYFFGVGSGHDIIEDNGANDNIDVDVVKLGVESSEVELTRGDTDVVIKIIATGETLTLQDYFYGNFTTDHPSARSVEKLEFSDGTVWDVAEVASNAWIRGTEFADTIIGTRDADTIFGGTGDDSLEGRAGDDTYIIASGAGNDTIQESYVSTPDDQGIDSVKFIDTTIDEVEFRKVTDLVTNELSLVIARKDGSASATFDLNFVNLSGIETIEFSDGVHLTFQEAFDRGQFLGTNASEIIYGSGNTDDLIVGRGGDDELWGGGGDDKYMWSRGDGNDVIKEYDSSYGDTLHLSGIDPALVRLERVAQPHEFDAPYYDLIVHILPLYAEDAYEAITVAQEFDSIDEWPGSGIEFIEFDNGVVWNRAQLAAFAPLNGSVTSDWIAGSNFSDLITGGLGDDELEGKDGNDTYVWTVGDGDDSIRDGQSSADVDTLILHGVDPSDIMRIPDSQLESPDLLLRINSTGEEIRLINQLRGDQRGIDRVVFDNGVVWDAKAITFGFGTGANDVLVGDGSQNFISGMGGDDTITGLGGDDFIDGGQGNDTVIYTGNRSDYLISVNQQQQALVIQDTRPGGDGTDYIRDIEYFSFADGTIEGADILSIIGTENDDELHGDITANLIDGRGGNDVVYGGDGNDRIIGGTGNDVLWGQGGNDSFQMVAGDGDDIIHGGEGHSNELDFAALSQAIVVDLTVGIATSVESGADTVSGINIVRGGSGNDVIAGGLGNDELHGGGGIDSLGYQTAAGGVNVNLGISGQQDTGGAGRDTVDGFESLIGSGFADQLSGDGGDNRLTGLGGGDRFVFTGTFGHDTVTDFALADDSLVFWDTLFADKAAVLAAANQVGSDVVIDAGAHGSITLAGMTEADLADAQIVFEPGPVDAPDIVKLDTILNTDIANAIVINPADFDLVDNPDIGLSQTVPHATVLATASGNGSEYYAVTVEAGDHVVFDIDQGNFDSVISLLDAGGNVISTDDDNYDDPGSYGNNSLLEHTFDEAGTYYLQVGNFDGTSTGGPLDAGATYALHVSIEESAGPPASNTPPILTGGDISLGLNATVAASTLFSVADAENDAITAYQFYDANAASTSAHWTLNGIEQAANQPIEVLAADLDDAALVAGSIADTDMLWMRANDGTSWGEWHSVSAASHA